MTIENFLARAALADMKFTIPYGPDENPHGLSGRIELTPEQVIDYVADPTGFMARRHGGSKADYIAWAQRACGEECDARTSKGRRCNIKARHVSLEEWIATGRRNLCFVHLYEGTRHGLFRE